MRYHSIVIFKPLSISTTGLKFKISAAVTQLGILGCDTTKWNDNIIYKSGLANEFENIQAELDSYDNVYSKLMSLIFLVNKDKDDTTLIFAVIFMFELLENIQYDITKVIRSNKGLNPFFYKIQLHFYSSQ